MEYTEAFDIYSISISKSHFQSITSSRIYFYPPEPELTSFGCHPNGLTNIALVMPQFINFL
jgi:hypothetical protein